MRHTPLVAAKYNRQNRTENPLEMGGEASRGQEGGDEAAWGELGDSRGGDLGVGEGGGGRVEMIELLHRPREKTSGTEKPDDPCCRPCTSTNCNV